MMLENLILDEKSKYEKKNFSNLLGVEGLSNNQMETHFALYEGYVNNTNKLLDDLKKMREAGESETPEYAEIKRRFGWEWDGMRLHELYFSGMGIDSEVNPESNVYKAIEKNFDSFDNWKNDFIATGKMRGIGWVVLYQDLTNGKLVNCWINEHDGGHLVGGNPIIIMDVFEHAYFIDYGKDRPKYIDAYMKLVNWGEVEKRLK